MIREREKLTNEKLYQKTGSCKAIRTNAKNRKLGAWCMVHGAWYGSSINSVGGNDEKIRQNILSVEESLPFWKGGSFLLLQKYNDSAQGSN